MHVLVREPSGLPAGPPLVLLHGYGDSHFSFSRLLPQLPTDRKVVVPDLRGHGRTAARPGMGLGMDALAADVLGLLDALEIRSFVVVGHSMGTFVARRMAEAAADRVVALVLIGGAPSGHGISGLPDLRAAVEALEDPVPESFIRAFQESTVVADVPPEFMDGVVAESFLLTAAGWKAGLAGMLAGSLEGPPPPAGPTLLVWGELDPVFEADQRRRLLERLPGARAVVVPGVGHAPHWEAPEALAAAVIGFLASPGADGAPSGASAPER